MTCLQRRGLNTFSRRPPSPRLGRRVNPASLARSRTARRSYAASYWARPRPADAQHAAAIGQGSGRAERRLLGRHRGTLAQATTLLAASSASATACFVRLHPLRLRAIYGRLDCGLDLRLVLISWAARWIRELPGSVHLVSVDEPPGRPRARRSEPSRDGLPDPDIQPTSRRRNPGAAQRRRRRSSHGASGPFRTRTDNGPTAPGLGAIPARWPHASALHPG